MSTDAAPADVPPAWLTGALAAAWPELAPRLGVTGAAKDLQSGRYVWADPALAAAWGRRVDEVVGHVDAELFDPALSAALRAAEQTAAASGEWLTSEHRIEVAGRRRDYKVMRRVLPRGPQGAPWLLSLWIDEQLQRQKDAQLRRALEQLEQLQRAHESLRRELQEQGARAADAGPHARGQFDDQLRREVDLSTREHREFALVLIELDPPDETVGALGAPAMQRIHEAVGRLLRGNTRAMDAACRLDERRFAVLLSGVGLATAHARMEGLRRQCATQIVVQDGQELGFSVSMGVASFPHTADSQEALVRACDAALAEARRRGGNHVTLARIPFDPR